MLKIYTEKRYKIVLVVIVSCVMSSIIMPSYAKKGGIPNSSPANSSGNVSGDASIQIAVPIQISQDTALNFGEVIRLNNEYGTVKITKDGVRTGNNVVLEDNSNVNAGRFEIIGEKNRQVNVSIDKEVSLRNEQGDVLVMSTDGDTPSKLLGNSGKSSYNVGGEVAIDKNQQSGNYNGTYNVTVS